MNENLRPLGWNCAERAAKEAIDSDEVRIAVYTFCALTAGLAATNATFARLKCLIRVIGCRVIDALIAALVANKLMGFDVTGYNHSAGERACAIVIESGYVEGPGGRRVWNCIVNLEATAAINLRTALA